MTYQLSRLRLASVGDRAARFTDLTLNMSSLEADVAGQPVDSILWLRNGGGKSSLLSLFFALLLPLRRDFMGKSVKRYLEDYVASGDTSHTVAEWVAQSDDSLIPAPRLITGAVYEWVDRRKPVDPDRDRDKLRGWYYTFFVVPGALDLARLPVHDEAGRVRPMAEFVRRLREIAATRPQQFLFSITDQRGQWRETLTARDLDPALFGYQKQMNHSEGGVAELFNFPSTDKFVDFLIDLTVDSAQPDLVAANLRKVISVLGRKPDLLVDRDFCGEMAAKLDALAERHDLATRAARAAAEAREVAARLAGALRSAASAKEVDKEWFTEENQRLRGDALKLDRERNRVNDTANELFRIAAVHRYSAAVKAREDAAVTAVGAKNENLAWEAVEPLADRMEAERQAESVREQMAEEERQTAPLRASRDDAAAALKTRYATLAAEELAAEEMEKAAAEDAKATSEAEAERADANRVLSAEAKVRAEDLRAQVAEIDEALEGAVSRGDLPDSAAVPAVVLAEARTAKREAANQLDAVRQRRAERPRLRESMAVRRTDLAADKAERVAERDRHVTDRARLDARVDELAADPRLAELTQLEEGGRLDLWAEAADLRSALTHGIATAESAIVDNRVDAADDDRALAGLRADDFLPTSRDAQRAAEVLVAAGVLARPGWELLRDLVTETERAEMLENAHVAELAAGVVVADADAGSARSAVASQDWHSVSHVTVCTASQMQQALDEAAPAWLVVPNDPALFDGDAAESARTERELRRHEQDQRLDALREQIKVDQVLRGALEALLHDCPPGHLEALQKAVDEHNQAIKTIEISDGTLREQIAELDLQESRDADAEAVVTEQILVLAGKIERLTALADKVFGLRGLRQASEELDKLAESHERVAGDAAARAKSFQETERSARDRAGDHRSNRQRYERDSQAISLLDHDHAGAVESRDPLSLLQSRFAELDTRWATEAAQSVLAERLKSLIERVGRADRTLAGYPEAIRERAVAFLDTGDGQDPERRAAAKTRSRDHADKAHGELRDADSELKQAQDELDRRKPRDRVRHAQLEVEPATEAEARALAEQQARRATEMSTRVTNLHREADEAEKAANEADTVAQVFGQQASRLSDAAIPVVVPKGIPPYGGTDAETELKVVLEQLNSAANRASSTQRQEDEAVRNVRKLASENRFAGIPDAIRDRFTADESDVLAERAVARAGEMRVRRTTIEGQLADIGRDQRLVVVEVATLVRDVLANLESAHRHSKLPGTLGGWGNEHFLRIRFVRPGSEEDLQARIDAVVDRIVAENSKPEGLALLKRCVHEAVAPRGFSVKVLKPNSDLAVEPVDVTHLGKFSGGEKLTVCVALYCTLARLRAVNRGRGKGAIGGTLVLDNPLGTASHVALLRLQRDVAAAHGVQLVYTTGVEDLGAVGQFPNVLRMRNSPGALRTRRYVVVEEQFGSGVEGITSARVTRDDGAVS